MNKIYYIENTLSEYSTIIKGYFITFEEAKEVLKQCCDWYAPYPGGTIYEVELGFNKEPKKVFKGWWNGEEWDELYKANS